MNIKLLLEEVINKGGTLKNDLAKEVVNSKVLNDFLESDLFAKAVTTAIKTKDEVTRLIRTNVKNAMQVMDIPTRHELSSLERKLDQLEKTVDRTGKKVLTVKSIKSIQNRKAAKKK